MKFLTVSAAHSLTASLLLSCLSVVTTNKRQIVLSLAERMMTVVSLKPDGSLCIDTTACCLKEKHRSKTAADFLVHPTCWRIPKHKS